MFVLRAEIFFGYPIAKGHLTFVAARIIHGFF